MFVVVTKITDILEGVEGSDRTEKLLPIVYDELRRIAAAQLAQEGRGQTLQPTGLVHEAYIRLVGASNHEWENRGHFFGAAAQAMRRILIDRARQKKSLRRGAGQRPLELLDVDATIDPLNDDLLDLDEALKKLEQMDSAAAKLVELRVFAGLSTPEAAEILDIPERSARRTWQYARAWLRRALGGGENLEES